MSRSPEEVLIMETLKRAGDLVREAAQMVMDRGSPVPPEEAARCVRALMLRAIMPKVAAQEFNRLGGGSIDVFGAAVGPSLGSVVRSIFGWQWLLDVTVNNQGV